MADKKPASIYHKIGKTDFNLDEVRKMKREDFIARHKKLPDAGKVWDELEIENKKRGRGQINSPGAESGKA